MLHIPPTFNEGVKFAKDGFTVLTNENDERISLMKNTILLEEDAEINLASITAPINHLSGKSLIIIISIITVFF